MLHFINWKAEEQLRILVDNRKIDNVSQFQYLRSLFGRVVQSTKDIRKDLLRRNDFQQEGGYSQEN